jgi:hypothetical protein
VLNHPRLTLLQLLSVVLGARGRSVREAAVSGKLVRLGVLELAGGDASAEEDVELACSNKWDRMGEEERGKGREKSVLEGKGNEKDV